MYFKYGLEIEGITYGWYKKELYRLPFNSEDNRYYSTKKLNQILIRNQIGYRLSGKRYTLNKLKNLTKLINLKEEILISNDLPF